MALIDKLISSWPMNELSGSNVADAYGANDGTATGATINSTTPMVGDANRILDGFDDRIQMVGYKGDRFGSSARAFSIIMKSTATKTQSLFSYGLNNPAKGFNFTCENNKLGLRISGAFITYTATNLNDGNAHQIDISVPNGATLNDIDFHMNGSLLTSVASSSSPTTTLNTTSFADVYIGRIPAATIQDFDGELDAAHWFDNEITLAESQELYNGGSFLELPVVDGIILSRRGLGRGLNKGLGGGL